MIILVEGSSVHNDGLGRVIPASSHVRFAKPCVFQKSFINHQPNLSAKQLLNLMSDNSAN